MKKEKRKVTSVSGTALAAGVGQNFEDRHRWLVLRQDKEFGLEVVDLAKDPFSAGPLARSTTRNLILDKALHGQSIETTPSDYQDVQYAEQRNRLGHDRIHWHRNHWATCP